VGGSVAERVWYRTIKAVLLYEVRGKKFNARTNPEELDNTTQYEGVTLRHEARTARTNLSISRVGATALHSQRAISSIIRMTSRSLGILRASVIDVHIGARTD
jgi:hypothetical protein